MIINDDYEYRKFTDRIGKREDFSGKTVLLMTDITTGGNITNFNGILDGCGHTINISRISPFKILDGATVKNLTVSGNTNIAGTQIRTILGLKSTNFTFSQFAKAYRPGVFKFSNVIFTNLVHELNA